MAARYPHWRDPFLTMPAPAPAGRIVAHAAGTALAMQPGWWLMPLAPIVLCVVGVAFEPIVVPIAGTMAAVYLVHIAHELGHAAAARATGHPVAELRLTAKGTIVRWGTPGAAYTPRTCSWTPPPDQP